MTKDPPPPHRTGLRGSDPAPRCPLPTQLRAAQTSDPPWLVAQGDPLSPGPLLQGLKKRISKFQTCSISPLLPPVQQIPAGSGRALARAPSSLCRGSPPGSLGLSGAPSCRQPPSWAPPTHPPPLRYRERPQDIPAQPQRNGWRPLTNILPPGPRLWGAPGNTLATPPTARGSPRPHPASNPSFGTSPLAAGRPTGTFCTSPPRTPQLCPPAGCR